MIEQIKLKYSLNNIEETLEFDPGPITIFLGPNNGGKSLLLKEIERYCTTNDDARTKILLNLNIILPTPEQAIQSIKKNFLISVKNNGKLQYGKLDTIKDQRDVITIDEKELKKLLLEKSHSSLFTHFVSLFVLRLDAIGRLTLVNDRITNDVKNPANNILNELFKNSEKNELLNSIIEDVLKKHFVIDPTSIRTLRIRLANDKPLEKFKKSLSKESAEYFGQQPHISEYSDGIKAFVGLLMASIVSSSKILLLDEPEAFLHPSLANRLGKEISKIMNEREGNLLVATHSQKFLMGCIESGKKVNVVRLTYDGNNNSTAKILDSETLVKLMQNPLLRSIGVLEALFYNFVIVTEADADRAFYQEINNRLLDSKSDLGIQDCLFLNAHGHHKMWDIVKPLREIGIPTAAIVDIDIIKKGGEEWNKVLEAANIPKSNHDVFRKYRESNLKVLNNTGKNMKLDGGINTLQGKEKDGCIDFFEQMQSYGIFIVPIGEVERWLPKLDIVRSKKNWLDSIFEKLGSDPNTDNYVLPDNDDVWKFIGKIKKWFILPKRKGMPN
jgi:predicted ATPase